MEVFMKNLLFIFTILGFIAGFEQALIATSVTTTIPTITPESTPATITACATASLTTLALGGTLWTIGKYGPANTIGSTIAIAVGSVTYHLTTEGLKILIANKIALGLLSANPLATALTVGSIAAGLMLWIRDSYLPQNSPTLEQYGMNLLKVGTVLSVITALNYYCNTFGCELCLPIHTKPPIQSSPVQTVRKWWHIH
jgi:hypothetical protein